MPTKQSLLEFQNRLAERLRAARTAGVAASWLAVRAGDVGLLLPLSHADEIFPWTDIQRVPYVQPWFMGVSNLRGTLASVVDLGVFLGGTGAGQRSPLALSQCWMVTINSQLQVNCALLVDELLGMRTTESFLQSTPADPSAPPYFGHTYIDAQGGQWRELSLQSLSQQELFLNVDA